MASSTYKVLGQSAPAAGNYTTALYTVPASTSTVVSTINVANRSNTAETFRIRVAVANAAVSNAQWTSYDVYVKPNGQIPVTIGITLGAGDVIYAGSANGNASFNAFGQELGA